MTDERVRRAMGELRAADERETPVPSYSDVLRRRRPRVVWRVSPTRLALAASLLVAIALGYRALPGGRDAEPLRLPREVASLSAWRPMTDVLLETPGRGILRNASPLGASIINVNIGELR